MCDFAMDGLPKIRIEFAKSGRASCKNKNPKREDLKCFSCPGGEPKIAAGSLRCGVLNSDYNNYWQFKHLGCWRVPERVYEILPDDLDDTAAVLKAIKKAKDVVISMDSFEDKDMMKIVAWVRDRANWANHNAEGLCYRGPNKVTTPAKKKKKRPAAALEPAAEGPTTPEKPKKKAKKAPAKKEGAPSRPGVVKGRPKVNTAAREYTTDNLPVPGQVAAAPDCLAGHRVVVTGFSKAEKTPAEDLVLAFGAKKVGSVSKLTKLLLCGRAPGSAKVDKAATLGVPKLDFADFCDALRDGSIAKVLA